LGPPEHEAGVLTSVPSFLMVGLKNKQAVGWNPKLYFYDGLFND
jgi:hypothetical protein